jgi:ABC-type nitrate/sulfonate/bicarbonate transport system substrate-binding protein
LVSLASRRFCGKGTGGRASRRHPVRSKPGIHNSRQRRNADGYSFAQINEMDGSFITGRVPDPDFDWKRLEGSEVILFGGGQPLAMFNYACHKAGIDFAKLKVIGLGSAEEMDKAFREGKGHDRA